MNPFFFSLWPLCADPPSVGIFTIQKKKALRGPGCTAAACYLTPRRMSPTPKEQARGSLAHGDLAKRGRAASAQMVTPPQGEQDKAALALARPV